MTAEQLIEQAYDYFLQLAADHLSADVITSYSIHYTKLYDAADLAGQPLQSLRSPP